MQVGYIELVEYLPPYVIKDIFSFLVWTIIEYRFKAYVVSFIFLNIYFLDASVAAKEEFLLSLL